MKSIFILISFLFVFSGNAYADDDPCLKKVFLKFCLGGPSKELPVDPALELPRGLFGVILDSPPAKDEDDTIYFPKENVLVIIFDNKVAFVNKGFSDYSWLKYLRLKNKLSTRYGDPEDFSSFPSYAKRLSIKETTIHLGKGEAVHRWQQKEWAVILAWRGKSASLSYQHDSLFKKYTASKDDGL